MTFRVFLYAHAKPSGKMDINTFGLEKFPCLGVILFERYICEIEKTAFRTFIDS